MSDKNIPSNSDIEQANVICQHQLFKTQKELLYELTELNKKSQKFLICIMVILFIMFGLSMGVLIVTAPSLSKLIDFHTLVFEPENLSNKDFLKKFLYARAKIGKALDFLDGLYDETEYWSNIVNKEDVGQTEVDADGNQYRYNPENNKLDVELSVNHNEKARELLNDIKKCDECISTMNDETKDSLVFILQFIKNGDDRARKQLFDRVSNVIEGFTVQTLDGIRQSLRKFEEIKDGFQQIKDAFNEFSSASWTRIITNKVVQGMDTATDEMVMKAHGCVKRILMNPIAAYQQCRTRIGNFLWKKATLLLLGRKPVTDDDGFHSMDEEERDEGELMEHGMEDGLTDQGRIEELTKLMDEAMDTVINWIRMFGKCQSINDRMEIIKVLIAYASDIKFGQLLEEEIIDQIIEFVPLISFEYNNLMCGNKDQLNEFWENHIKDKQTHCMYFYIILAILLIILISFYKNCTETHIFLYCK